MIKAYLRRLVPLFAGLAATALGVVLSVQANIGLEPWSILNNGIEVTTGMSFGAASVLVGVIVILISLLLGEPFGIGTLANIFCCGPMIDLIMATGLIPKQTNLWAGLFMLVVGLEFIALGTWLYMTSGLGSGPRDSLMVALAKRTHQPVGFCRSVTEVLVTVIGFLLGGQLGIGTVVAAVGIGVLFQITFNLVHFHAVEQPQETLKESWNNLRKSGEPCDG